MMAKRQAKSVMRVAKKRADYCGNNNISSLDLLKKRNNRKQSIVNATNEDGFYKSQVPTTATSALLSPIEFNRKMKSLNK